MKLGIIKLILIQIFVMLSPSRSDFTIHVGLLREPIVCQRDTTKGAKGFISESGLAIGRPRKTSRT